MDVQISKNEGRSRFEITGDGELVGFAEYFDDEGYRQVPHTEVDPSYQGQGLAGKLVGYALTATREEGLKADPICPYVASFIQRHPSYQDLLG